MKEVRIPFSGFYESMWSSEMDRVEEMETERLAEEHGIPVSEIGDLLWQHVNNRKAEEKIAEDYIEVFANYFNLVTLKPATRVMESPKYYNFETDRVFAVISVEEAYEIYRKVGKKTMRKWAEKMFRSRDGFISHYDWDLDEWGQLRSWDHNQLYCLMCAYVNDGDFYGEGDWEWHLLEDMNEPIWNAVAAAVDWSALNLEIGKMLGAKEKEEELTEPVDDRKFPVNWKSTLDYVSQFIKMNGYAT